MCEKIESDKVGGWKFILDILPPIQIPQPNLSQQFPTPSGWQPPASNLADKNYKVRINKYVLWFQCIRTIWWKYGFEWSVPV